jgi:hypothetical protein
LVAAIFEVSQGAPGRSVFVGKAGRFQALAQGREDRLDLPGFEGVAMASNHRPVTGPHRSEVTHGKR